MPKAEPHQRQAREVATWLDSIGEHKRANDVRNVCRSLDTARNALSQLHKDNMELRRKLAPLSQMNG